MPETGELISDDVGEQTKQALTNLKNLLADQNLTLADVIKVTVYITSMGDFQAVNEVYKTFFVSEYPARSCIAVNPLPKNAKIEIEALIAKTNATTL